MTPRQFWLLAERHRESERAADYRAAIIACVTSGMTRKKPLQPGDFFVSLRTTGAASGNGRGQTPEQQLAIFRHIFSDRLNVKN